MVSYYNQAMFGRTGTGHHLHAHHTSPTQNPYFPSAYSAAPYHHPAAHHAHHHQPPNTAAGVVTSSQFSPTTDYNCNHQYHHQFGSMTPDSMAVAAAAGWHHQPIYSACAARNMVPGGYDDWTHAHGHPPPFYHPQQPSPPSSTPSPNSTHGTGNQSPNLYTATSGPAGFKSEFSPSGYKTEFGPCSGGNSQENASHEVQSQTGVSNAVVSSGGPPTAVSTGTSHSPDSGMAVSDGVSSSGSPATGQHCLGGHHNHSHHLSSTTMLNPSMLGSQHVNLNQQSLLQQQHSGSSSSTHTSGISSNGRPAQARSPFEWMKKPSYSSVTSNSGGKTRTKDKYRVVYSDTQRLELEKEFHYSRYITIRRKSELASNLGLSERQVKIWFQNRRAKERKVARKHEEMSHRESIAKMVQMQNAAVHIVNGGMPNAPGMCSQSNVSMM